MIPASSLLGITAGLIAFIALLIFLNAIWVARRAQRAAYYSVRRNAQRIAHRRLTLSLSTFVLAGALMVISRALPDEAARSLPPADANVARAEAGETIASAAAVFKATPPATPTLTQSAVAAAPPPTPRATPIAEPTSTLIGALATPADMPTRPSAAQVAPDKRLTLNAIASGIDANGAPVGISTTFTPGVETIYIFFDFRDAPPSALLRHSWFRGGGSVFFRSSRLGKNGQGTAYISWSPPGGFQPGLYEVRVALGGVPQFVANFEVREGQR
ncbi:MAG: hypothetical protein KatS3mg052_1368 [Candidatus Roseilinea sp.]|nr:MAG: hypothetical protein KatS3mg052_1368 [Candidatus Roseilinea sp.]